MTRGKTCAICDGLSKLSNPAGTAPSLLHRDSPTKVRGFDSCQLHLSDALTNTRGTIHPASANYAWVSPIRGRMDVGLEALFYFQFNTSDHMS